MLLKCHTRLLTTTHSTTNSSRYSTKSADLADFWPLQLLRVSFWHVSFWLSRCWGQKTATTYLKKMKIRRRRKRAVHFILCVFIFLLQSIFVWIAWFHARNTHLQQNRTPKFAHGDFAPKSRRKCTQKTAFYIFYRLICRLLCDEWSIWRLFGTYS